MRQLPDEMVAKTLSPVIVLSSFLSQEAVVIKRVVSASKIMEAFILLSLIHVAVITGCINYQI